MTEPQEALYPPGDDPAECGCGHVHEDVRVHEMHHPAGDVLQFVENRAGELECVHYLPIDGPPRKVTIEEAKQIVASKPKR